MADQELPVDATVGRLQDDVEFLRIGCDKLARAGRDSTERFNSLEKQIINIGAESNSKIGALERQMILISGALARIEAQAFVPQPAAAPTNAPTEAAPSSSSQPATTTEIPPPPAAEKSTTHAASAPTNAPPEAAPS
ncbi:hypothetical protein DY000_02009591 [Brassica cretica]|uniref:Uncharacterized protein n=1 Tax=Brassica cretica TaxID=69181 RepID=A0ABQ7BUL6_BRACR|nr:hypothetical protein DY000_02009591 [Brassica cretica]